MNSYILLQFRNTSSLKYVFDNRKAVKGQYSRYRKGNNSVTKSGRIVVLELYTSYHQIL